MFDLVVLVRVLLLLIVVLLDSWFVGVCADLVFVWLGLGWLWLVRRFGNCCLLWIKVVSWLVVLFGCAAIGLGFSLMRCWPWF